MKYIYTLITIITFTLSVSWQINAENLQNSSSHKECADRIEKVIIEKFIKISSQEIAQNAEQNNFLSLQFLSFLDNDPDVRRIKEESSEECRNVHYRLEKYLESMERDLQCERDQKGMRKTMLWGAHLSSSTGMIYAGIQCGIIIPEHKINCAISALAGVGLSYAVWKAGDFAFFNNHADQKKINEIRQMKTIINDKLRYCGKKK